MILVVLLFTQSTPPLTVKLQTTFVAQLLRPYAVADLLLCLLLVSPQSQLH